MTSLQTIQKEVEKIKQKVKPKPKRFIKVWMADCLVARRDLIVDTKTDEKGHKWVAFKVECRE